MPNYQIQFELRSGQGNFENIVITNVNPTPAGDERAYIKITKPGGTVIKDQDFNTPDLDLNGGPTEYTISIPTTTGGDYLAGTYLIEIAEDTPGDPGVYYEETYSFYWCPLELKGVIGFVANCICGKITITDETSYGTGTVVDRTMTVYPPNIPGQPPPTPTETSNESMIISFGYANVQYQTILEVEMERTIITGVISNEELTKTQWNKVICDYNFCELLTCVQAEYDRILTLASAKGGIKNIAAAELDGWLKLTKNFQLLNSFMACGDYSSAQDMYEQIKDDLNCDCDCGDANTTEPVAISPACGGEEGFQQLTVEGVYPIEVDLVDGVYLISLDGTWLAKVDALRGHTHESDNDFLSISESYDGGANLTTWTHSIVQGDWNYMNFSDFATDFQDVGEGNVLAYRLENATGNLVVRAEFNTATALVVGDSYNLLDSGLPLGFRPASESPICALLASDGTFAGTVQLGIDGQITLIPAIDFWTDELQLHFQIITDLTFTWAI